MGRAHLDRAIGVHVTAFLLLSLSHCVLAGAVGGPLLAVPPHYAGSLLKLRFLEEFYSDIWMYRPLVCIKALIDSHARARESRFAAIAFKRRWNARAGISPRVDLGQPRKGACRRFGWPSDAVTAWCSLP